eukprot:Colp12_sorted_trinity150504_noHs@8668
MGALISEKHMEKVLGYMEKGVAEGARLRVGGGRFHPSDPAFSNGFFVTPTIFDECADHMSIVREEIFGPVMCVLPFSDEDEVISRANATIFGLAAGVCTQSLERAHRVAAQLESGLVYVNNYNLAPIELPFGGNKQSGLGRENGIEALEHYTQVKTVYVELDGVSSVF